MIDRRINYQYGGGADLGAGATGMGSGNFGGNISGGGNNKNTERNRIQNERAADVRAKELANLATQNFGQGDTSRDVFGFRGTFENEGVRGLARQYLSPSNILGGILGLINPVLGLGFRAVNYLKDEVPETLGQFKDSATLEEFRDKVRGYGRTMPTVSPNPMYGGIESLAVNPQITRDLFAFNPGSVKDRALKQQYGIYNATGMMNPNMIDLMKQDIELNKQKGTPLSLPAEAYSLIG